mgnify:CR=1 FL=1
MTWKRLLLIFLIVSSLSAAWTVNPVQALEGGRGICNGPDEPIYILVLGIDWRHPGYLYGLADTIMVFRVDFQARDVRVMGFPRDMWVEIPGIEDKADRTHGKLNQAYFFGTEGMGYYDGEGYGAGLLSETMRVNWDLEIDHYLVLNMRVFRDVIDAMGGIKVYNPSPVYSFHSKKPKYLAGGMVMGGREALMYARTRDLTRNVLDRVDRHEIMLKAICEQAWSLEVIPHIPELIASYRGNVFTDMHLSRISQLLCLSASVDQESIQYTRIPHNILYQPDWEGAVWLEKEEGAIKEWIAAFQSPDGLPSREEGSGN